MRIAPPADQILGAKDPGLAMLPVSDRKTVLRGTVGGIGIIPVESLAGAEPVAQIIEIVSAARDTGIEVIATVAPIGDRGIVIDPDRIDIRMRPERIERESVPPALRRATCAPYSVQSAA